jgi:hypothetical protein
MTAQLELAALPVADPHFAAEAQLERDLEAMLEAVGVALDDDEQTAPTARNLAELLWCAPGELEPWGGPLHGRASVLLAELVKRGAVEATDCIPCYFARGDEPATVIRYNTARPSRESPPPTMLLPTLDERINARGWAPKGTDCLRSLHLAPRYVRMGLAASMVRVMREIEAGS